MGTQMGHLFADRCLRTATRTATTSDFINLKLNDDGFWITFIVSNWMCRLVQMCHLTYQAANRTVSVGMHGKRCCLTLNPMLAKFWSDFVFVKLSDWWAIVWHLTLMLACVLVFISYCCVIVVCKLGPRLVVLTLAPTHWGFAALAWLSSRLVHLQHHNRHHVTICCTHCMHHSLAIRHSRLTPAKNEGIDIDSVGPIAEGMINQQMIFVYL